MSPGVKGMPGIVFMTYLSMSFRYEEHQAHPLTKEISRVDYLTDAQGLAFINVSIHCTIRSGASSCKK